MLSGGMAFYLKKRIKISTTSTIRYKFKSLQAKWLRELLQLDPPSIFRQVICPALLVGGEKDFQCNPNDVDQISKLVLGKVEKHIIPDLTHILRFDKEKTSIFKYGKLIKRPVENFVLELISNWLK